ncbi:hypothetical protein HY995_01205 [Candidatus Micrarchaeota archaeon]|nr:hypothetical protein [Candidatus Micrarchaeota archaeon]
MAARNVISLALLVLLIPPLAFAGSTMRVPAVDTAGQGVLTTATASVQPGEGKIFVDIQPFFSIETQQSSKSAVAAASSLAGVDRNKFNFYYEIFAQAEIVDGPSGGVALALLSYAELAKKKLRSDLSATGTITSDGGVGKVGGVFEKASAASQQGIKVLLIPAGQAIQNGVDLTTYAPEKWGLQVVEVGSLREAVKFAFSDEGSAISAPSRQTIPLSLPAIALGSAARPLGKVTAHQLEGIAASVGELGRKSGPTALYNRSAIDLNNSQYLFGKGYLYSAANLAFVTRVSVESYLLSNITRQELSRRLGEVEGKALSIRFANKTAGNLEWAASAQLRAYWALERIDDARKNLQIAPIAQAVQSLAAAENWEGAAEDLNAAAAEIGGGSPSTQAGVANSDSAANPAYDPASSAAINELALRGYAGGMMENARKLVAAAGDSEATMHLKTARREFSAGAYAASILDSAYATAFSRALSENGESPAEELIIAVGNQSRLAAYNASGWAQLFYAHALYSLGEYNRTGDYDSLGNAVKLRYLSDEFSTQLARIPIEASQDIPLGAGGNSTDGNAASSQSPSGALAPGNLKVAVTTVPSRSAGIDARALALVALIAIGLAMMAVLYLLKRRHGEIGVRPHIALRAARQKLDALDELLVAGKISEGNYDRLREKYEGKLEELGSELEADENEAVSEGGTLDGVATPAEGRTDVREEGAARKKPAGNKKPGVIGGRKTKTPQSKRRKEGR